MTDILDCKLWCVFFSLLILCYNISVSMLLLYRNGSDGNSGCNLTQEKNQERKSSILIFQIMIIISNAKKKKLD